LSERTRSTPDPARVVPADGAAQEGDALDGAFAGQELGVGEARVVVDGQVQVLPAGPARAVAPVPVDRLPIVQKRAEALDVDMDELARRERS
jgi:hypothetical protein